MALTRHQCLKITHPRHHFSDLFSSGKQFTCPCYHQSFIVFQQLTLSGVYAPLKWNTMLFLFENGESLARHNGSVYLHSFCNLRSLAVFKRRSAECSGCTDRFVASGYQNLACEVNCSMADSALSALWWFVHDTGICIWGRSSPVPVLPLGLALSPCVFT